MLSVISDHIRYIHSRPPRPKVSCKEQQSRCTASLQLQPSDSGLPTRTPDSLKPGRAITDASDQFAGAILAFAAARSENAKAKDDFGGSHQDTEDDQNDDDPCDACHFHVGDLVGEDFSEVEEDTAALVEDLDARFDLEVFAHALVEGVECWFRVPEEFGSVQHVACCLVQS